MGFDFVRSHGLGNDYLVMDVARLGFALTPERVSMICHRNTGVGSDGILVRVDPPKDVADFAVRILNPDGSEAEKSGNGLRIFAKFLYDHGFTKKTEFTIHTLGGVVRAKLILDDTRHCVAVRVDMGRAIIDRKLTKLEVASQTVSKRFSFSSRRDRTRRPRSDSARMSASRALALESTASSTTLLRQ